MIQVSGNHEALNALAEFKAYAASTLLVFDLLGTFVFALSGAAAGIKDRLDLFGVLVLSFAAASAGGIMRDLLIGAVPPGAISNWRYLAVSLLAGLVMFFWYPISERLRNLSNHILIFDAAGLALFAVVGTQKALGYRLNPVMAALLGVLTGIGGGMLRDILLSQVPTVLPPPSYTLSPLSSGRPSSWRDTCWTCRLAQRRSPARFSALASGLLAIRRGWQLPVAGLRKRTKAEADIADEQVDKPKAFD